MSVWNVDYMHDESGMVYARGSIGSFEFYFWRDGLGWKPATRKDSDDFHVTNWQPPAPADQLLPTDIPLPDLRQLRKIASSDSVCEFIDRVFKALNEAVLEVVAECN